jgi:hypothetical protein
MFDHHRFDVIVNHVPDDVFISSAMMSNSNGVLKFIEIGQSFDTLWLSALPRGDEEQCHICLPFRASSGSVLLRDCSGNW